MYTSEKGYKIRKEKERGNEIKKLRKSKLKKCKIKWKELFYLLSAWTFKKMLTRTKVIEFFGGYFSGFSLKS